MKRILLTCLIPSIALAILSSGCCSMHSSKGAGTVELFDGKSLDGWKAADMSFWSVEDGAITALHFQTALDGGGYGSYGVASTYYTGALQTVTYRIPRYRFEACRMFTNKPPCGPKRGHGTPQSRFGQEIQLDKIAESLSIEGPSLVRLLGGAR